MTEEEQKFAFAVAAVMGLIARGATPATIIARIGQTLCRKRRPWPVARFMPIFPAHGMCQGTAGQARHGQGGEAGPLPGHCALPVEGAVG